MDPFLELYRKELVVESGRKLDKARMIRFEERTGYFASTDLGRTASHFYIRYNTIEVHTAPLKESHTARIGLILKQRNAENRFFLCVMKNPSFPLTHK